MSELTKSPSWQALQRHAEKQKNVSLIQLFDGDRLRAERMSCEAAGLYLDYSKQRLGRETVDLLANFAEARGLPAAIAKMFSGERVNVTEQRPALHVALRNISGRPVMTAGRNVMTDITAVQERMAK